MVLAWVPMLLSGLFLVYYTFKLWGMLTLRLRKSSTMLDNEQQIYVILHAVRRRSRLTSLNMTILLWLLMMIMMVLLVRERVIYELGLEVLTPFPTV